MRTRTLIAGILVSGISLVALVPAMAQQQAGQQNATVAQTGPHHGRMGWGDRDDDRGPGRYERHGMGREMRGPMMGRGSMGRGDDRLMQEFDTDKDGKITQAEVDAALAARMTQYDKNGDGTLSLDEFQQLWLDNTRQMMVRAFQRHDADGNGQVTGDELGRGPDRMVQRMDRNGDGVLDQNDRPQHRGFERRGPGGPGGPGNMAPQPPGNN